jgi:hypothetical protein
MTDMENTPMPPPYGRPVAGPPVPPPAGGASPPTPYRPPPNHSGPPVLYGPPQPWPGSPVTGPPVTGPPTGSQPPPPRRKRRRLLLPLLSVVAVGFVGYAVTNAGDDSAPRREPGTEVAEPADLSPLDLQAGDCYKSAPLPADGSDTSITSVEAVPCTDPHSAQVITRIGYGGQDYADVVETRAPEDCAREAQARVRPELLTDEAYGFGQIHPEAGSWWQSQSVVCIVATETPRIGSSLI